MKARAYSRPISLVTGAAGFIGSHLCEYLVAQGHEVRGVDCFTDYYPRDRKESNIQLLVDQPGFSLVEADLNEAPLATLLKGAERVFHLAGQPGVRPSWGDDFVVYLRENVAATQRLLEEARFLPLRKFVYASSSSVYGDAESYPTPESVRPQPVSPYGVTKLAGEHLCELYRRSFDVPTVSLRLFTVYGPRQRPDMAFAKLVRSAVRGEPFELYGDGDQTRDFTYVGDVVKAMSDAARSGWYGVANIGGGARTSMNEVLGLVERSCGPIEIIRRPTATGDVRHTSADTTVATHAFGYAPRTGLAAGIEAMVSWEQARTKVART